MLWVGNTGNEMVGPWKVADSVKINSPSYVEFLKINLKALLKKKTLEFKCNTSAHAAIATVEYLAKLGLKWPF